MLIPPPGRTDMVGSGGGRREGNQLLAHEFTTIEKRLNFELQSVDENRQPLMARDATFPVNSAYPQVRQKQFSS